MSVSKTADDKSAVKDFWNAASCGESVLLPGFDQEGYAEQAAARYQLEPYIAPFADFEASAGQDVLEIGVGLGADHERFAKAGANLSGIDLTPRAIEHTSRRLAHIGHSSALQVGDAENLPFPDASFDMVYSWGVIHHSPDTPAAAREILRVLKPGGRFRVMIYHRHSLIGYMLWLRYALMAGRPFTGLDEIYAKYLESPGTKAYTVTQAAALFADAEDVTVWPELTHGDLLESDAGQRHEGPLLDLARWIWPRRLLRKFATDKGLFLLISGRAKAD